MGVRDKPYAPPTPPTGDRHHTHFWLARARLGVFVLSAHCDLAALLGSPPARPLFGGLCGGGWAERRCLPSGARPVTSIVGHWKSGLRTRPRGTVECQREWVALPPLIAPVPRYGLSASHDAATATVPMVPHALLTVSLRQ